MSLGMASMTDGDMPEGKKLERTMPFCKHTTAAVEMALLLGVIKAGPKDKGEEGPGTDLVVL